jgi:membrane-bound lytic murein transglycosylase D
VSLLALLLGACTTLQNSITGSESGKLQSKAPSSEPYRKQYMGAMPTDEVDAEKSYDDVWDRIRAGFSLPDLEHPYVDYYVSWYSEKPDYMERMMDRASRYLYHIVEELERHDFPMEIALLPAIESAYNPGAYSRAHAVGLWQFISATGKRYGLKQNWWYDGRRDVVGATDAAIQYLSFLRDEFDGDWFQALAAYNGGERRVQRAIEQNRHHGKPTDYQHLKLRRETMRYVPKLLAVKRIVQNPARYNVTLKPIPNRPYFEILNVGSQIDLGVVAEVSGVSSTELNKLNPGFRRWATDPAGPHRILVPAGTGDEVRIKLASLPPNERMRWTRYQVRKGDTLGEIGRRYGVSVSALQSSNRLRGTLIRTGQTLLVPLSGAAIAASDSGAGGQAVVHHVKRGDTLWGIARRYKVGVRQLQRWNELVSRDILRLGQKITVHLN